MQELKQAAAEFLAPGHRIAVAGVARGDALPANHIYRKLRAQGYTVFAVNPNADRVEGDRCYRALADIEGRVDGVVIGTPPTAALGLAQECAALGIERVWLHRGPGPGSVSEEAVRFCESHGIRVIAGACPMMYLEPVDLAHRCMCWVMGKFGKLPSGYRPAGVDA